MKQSMDYQICTRCVMDTSDEDIVFDEQGICNHCTAALMERKAVAYKKGQSEVLLEGILKKIKAKGRKARYDCLVGVSGGLDSSYVAHLAIKMGLRPLLLHIDNGWDSEIAVRNIRNLITALNVDYVSEVIDWESFRQVQLGFLKSSSVDLEMPTDIAILAATYKVAAREGINYIISGSNFSGECILPLTWGYHVSRDMAYYRHIVNRYSTGKLRRIPVVNIWKEIVYKFVHNIKTIYLLNYIDYNKEAIRTDLKELYNWESYAGKHHESRITAFWQGYVMPSKYNMDYRRATYSSQICAGQMSRATAIELLAAPPYGNASVAEQTKYISKKFGISVNEMDRYLSLPPKTYKDFPNQYKMIRFIFDSYRRIFKKQRV